MGLDEAGGIYLLRASVDESYVVRDPKYLGAGHYLSLTTTGIFFKKTGLVLHITGSTQVQTCVIGIRYLRH